MAVMESSASGPMEERREEKVKEAGSGGEGLSDGWFFLGIVDGSSGEGPGLTVTGNLGFVKPDVGGLLDADRRTAFLCSPSSLVLEP